MIISDNFKLIKIITTDNKEEKSSDIFFIIIHSSLITINFGDIGEE